MTGPASTVRAVSQRPKWDRDDWIVLAVGLLIVLLLALLGADDVHEWTRENWR